MFHIVFQRKILSKIKPSFQFFNLASMVSPTEVMEDCEMSEYGCCPDGVTTAMGDNFEGCMESKQSHDSFHPYLPVFFLVPMSQ